jgi:hypothetical protein
MAWLYKRALDDSIGLSSLLIMVLLDEQVYQAQREALIHFVGTLSGQKDADALGSKVHNAMCEVAGESARKGVAATASAYLWKLKQGAGAK